VTVKIEKYQASILKLYLIKILYCCRLRRKVRTD